MSEEYQSPLPPTREYSDPNAAGVWHSPGSFFLWIVRGLLMIAIAIGIYLSIAAISLEGVYGCDGSSGCDAVLQSKWSKWFSIPVSFLAVALYCSMFVLSFFTSQKTPESISQKAWTLLLIFSGMATCGAIWFIGLQVFELEKYCMYCIAAHLTMIVCTGFLWYRAPFVWRIGGRAPEESEMAISAGLMIMVVGISIVGVGVLAGGQYYLPEEDNISVEKPPPPSKNKLVIKNDQQKNGGANKTKAVDAEPKPEPREVSFYGENIKIDITQFPLIGPVDAEQVIIKLFDYTCTHCRDRHRQLEEVHKRCGDNLAIVLIPAPLNSGCNPHVRTSSIIGNHTSACVYAKLALTVWLSDPKKFSEFHNKMFAGGNPPKPHEARELVKELISESEYEAIYFDRGVKSELKNCVSIYATATNTGKSGLPIILTRESKVAGPGSTAAFINKLRKAGLKIPEQ